MINRSFRIKDARTRIAMKVFCDGGERSTENIWALALLSVPTSVIFRRRVQLGKALFVHELWCGTSIKVHSRLAVKSSGLIRKRRVQAQFIAIGALVL